MGPKLGRRHAHSRLSLVALKGAAPLVESGVSSHDLQSQRRKLSLALPGRHPRAHLIKVDIVICQLSRVGVTTVTTAIAIAVAVAVLAPLPQAL